MATAILGGLLKQGISPDKILVIDPALQQRTKLEQTYHITTRPQADNLLNQANTIIWAIKPQIFREAALATKPFLAQSSPLHISVAAGIKSKHIATWLQSERVVRVMPNTPALIGKGITGMYAMSAVSEPQRHQADKLLQTVGQTLWVQTEEQLDGITAVSGSGPAYAFYLIEAMEQAAQELGFTAVQAKQLAVSTVAGAAALAAQSSETAATLRERVTSKGGTTFAALSHMENNHIKQHLIQAIHKAAERSKELGDEFGNLTTGINPPINP